METFFVKVLKKKIFMFPECVNLITAKRFVAPLTSLPENQEAYFYLIFISSIFIREQNTSACPKVPYNISDC
jgi:hypothetical protein